MRKRLNHSDTNNNDSSGILKTHELRDPIKLPSTTLSTWKSDLPFIESETESPSNCIASPSHQAGNPRTLNQCAAVLNASVNPTMQLLLPRILSDLNKVYCPPMEYSASKVCPLTTPHLDLVQEMGSRTLIFQAMKLRLREQPAGIKPHSQEAGELRFEP